MTASSSRSALLSMNQTGASVARYYEDWIGAFQEYCKYGEAPKRMYFWTAISTIAGALRRKVWIDQAYFRWHTNMYIILVAPPGIVSKSTTATLGMRLLRKVPEIKFGPDVVTWPALVGAFEDAAQTFTIGTDHYTMSPLTLESSEFGNLLNPQDKEMVDLLVSLWDGKEGNFTKVTKSSGNDAVPNPWINLIACTTPAWIAGNFPEYMIGGGFTSRCVFVYADAKEQYVAYPGLKVPTDMAETELKLIADLEAISLMTGEFKLTPEAVAWGTQWYEYHYTHRPANLDDDRFGGYIARKQTHIHKLAMVLAASASDGLWISAENLKVANDMLTDLEPDMTQVFGRIGRSELSLATQRLIQYVEKRQSVPYDEAYRFVHAHFPSMKEFEDVIAGCIRAGFMALRASGSSMNLVHLQQKAPEGAERVLDVALPNAI